MDVVLLKGVESLGTEGAIVHVKPGYARNYLFPQGLAVLATPDQVKAVEETQRQRQQKTQRIQTEAEALKQKLEGRAWSLGLNVGADDKKAFGSVTVHDILEALKREGFEIERHAVHLPQPIKTLGTYDVPVRLHPAVTATLKLSVVKA